MEDEKALNLHEKSAFELCREFVLWDFHESAEELAPLICEFQKRPLRNHSLYFISMAILTNVLLLFIEATYRERWELFEDSTSNAKMQYKVTALIYLLPPLAFTVMLYFKFLPLFLYIVFISIFALSPLIAGIFKSYKDFKNYKLLIKNCA